jgi:ABC-type multidrug transport system ATPase subunit
MDEAASVERVTKTFGGDAVLRDVTLSVASGETVGLVGANGSGKTTLLRVMVGLIQPDTGSVRIGGQAAPVGLRRQRTAYCAGGSTLPGQIEVQHWARLFKTGGLLARDRRRFGTLSRGQRQIAALRVVLARSDLDLVVLDEPWEGLDPDGAEWLSRTLNRLSREGTAIVVSSHRFADLAAVGSRYAVLHQGVIFDVPAENGVAQAMVGAHLVDTYRRLTRTSP